uniref:Uncharacterized protein n=1 Tax=Hordeum vulgare subsp. vulgare TaxID=112509 RepID=A0A8I6X879_HORVV
MQTKRPTNHINSSLHPCRLEVVVNLFTTQNMSSMGFSYAQVHVKQERLRRRISDSEKAAATTTMGKSMAGEEEKRKENFMGEEEKKEACNSWTNGRVHPWGSSLAAAAPKGGHQ